MCDSFQTRRGCSRDTCRFLHVSRKALGAKAQLAQHIRTSPFFRPKKRNSYGFRKGGGFEFTQAEALGNTQVCAYFTSPQGCSKRDRCSFVHVSTSGYGMPPPFAPVMIMHPEIGAMMPVVPALGGLPVIPLGQNVVPVAPMAPFLPGMLLPG